MPPGALPCQTVFEGVLGNEAAEERGSDAGHTRVERPKTARSSPSRVLASTRLRSGAEKRDAWGPAAVPSVKATLKRPFFIHPELFGSF